MKTALKELNQSHFPAFCQLVAEKSQAWSRLLCFPPNKDFLQQQTFSDSDFDQELFLGAFCGETLVGAIFGIIRPWKNSNTGFVKFIILSGEVQGQDMLAEIEKRLRNKGVEQIFYGSASPYYLFPGVPIDDQPLRSLLISCGWQESSERISRVIDIGTMTITEAGLKELLDGNNLSLAIAAENERDEVLAFVETEFSQSWAKETLQAFIPGNPLAFCSICRDLKGDIVGFATIHSCNPNWFGPMGVKADQRKKGIGRLLVCHSLLHAKNQGTGKLLLPWINDKDTFYGKIIGEMEKHLYLKCGST